ncbi:MAG: hypothetical protein HY062_07250 [Bacteroidetes bacterium]|nr:hypothetical protein [Bacteroidota bacterium]
MIKKIVTYLIAFICILFVYRACLYAGIRKNKEGIYNKYNELFLKEGNTYDVLFIGSSRAEMHFNPKLFDAMTGLNSYNMGISGASPKISLALLKMYCHQHQKPKFIVCNIDYFSLQNDTDRLNDFPRYFPYLSNSYLRNGLYQMDHRFMSFYYNPLHSLPYTQIDYLSTSLHGWLGISGKYDSLMYKGFQTSEPKDINLSDEPKPVYSFISPKNRHYIDSLIAFTKNNGIQLLLVTSPVYGGGHKNVTNKQALSSQLQNIAFINRVPYYDYTDSLSYQNPRFFADYFHLNRQGALKFSKSISSTFDNIFAGKTLFNK